MKKELETLAIDIDEVLLDTLAAFLVYYNQRHKTSFKREDFPVYEWERTLKIIRQEIIEEFYGFMSSPLALETPQIPGARESLVLLKPRYNLVCPSNRSEDFRQVTQQQLELNFLGLIQGVYFGNHYSKNGSSLRKADIVKGLNVSYLIEDQLPISLECAESGISVLLLDSPWNQTTTLPSKITRVENWREITEKLMQPLS